MIEENLRALRRRYGAGFRVPAPPDPGRVRVKPSRSGTPYAEVDQRPYHSAYDPLREARKYYATFPVEQANTVLHFGWGLGYCGDVLRERIRPGTRVFIFEPDADLFLLSLHHKDHSAVIEDPRFEFVVGPGIRQFLDTFQVGERQGTDRFLWIEWRRAAELHPSIRDSIRSTIKTRIRDQAANLLTHFKNGPAYFANAAANFWRLEDPDVGRLFGAFNDVPLILVSAGPSLDRNIRHLRAIGGRCFLLAVDTALRPLTAAGIAPHAVIMADPSELNSRHVVGAMPPSTFLIAEQAVHPAAVRETGRRFFYSVGVFPDGLYAKFGMAGSRLDVWGSVATAALDLACRMGANPVIFVGQDFAFSWDRDYASHTIFHDNIFDAATVSNTRSLDVWGRQVLTTENLVAYRDFFIRKIRQTPHVRFINATEGGILTDGVELLSLRDALDQATGQKVDVAGILEQSHLRRSISNEPLVHLLSVLKDRREDCACLKEYLELVAKEHMLHGDDAGIEKSMEWGIRVLEKTLENNLQSLDLKVMTPKATA